MSTDIDIVLETARKFDGAREDLGPNRGPVPDFCNLWIIGEVGNYPWCATFVHTVGRLALGAAWPFPVTAAMSNVDEVVKFAQARGCFYPNADPRRGDIFTVRNWRKENDWTHTGFVAQGVGSDGHFESIEGNSNDDGSRDGNGVYIRRRQPSDYIDLIRWTEI